MATFTQVFSGNTVFPADQTYTSQNLTANLVLTWPVEVGSTSNIATTIINVTQSGAGFKIAVPAANLASTGKSILFNNTGSYSFTVTDTSGNTIIAVSPGQAWQIYLTDNSTANGIWSYFQQGSGTSVAQASSLIGYGIIASGQSLNQSMPVTQINSAYTLGAADRASVVVWTGGSGTVTLSSAATVGANWFANIKNAGAGTLTIALTGSDSIDGVSTITLSAQDSFIVLSNGTTYYTIGRTRLNNLAYTFLAIAVNASGTQTLSSAQYSNQILRFSGSLTGNLTVVFPTTIQQWDIDNQVTLNGFTLSLATAAGTPISVSAASRIIIFGDGTNVLNASPSSVTFPISIAQGGTNATTSGGALTNLGGTSVGVSLFTTASAAAARLSLLVDQRTAVADTNYTGLVTDRLIAYTSITVSRILTLPAANGFNPGETIIVVDESGSVSPTITLTVACAGADTLNGLANTILTIPYSYLTLESNGTNKWFVVSIVSSTTSTFSAGTSTGAANAQIVALPTPTGFALTRGNQLSFIAGFTNTSTATLAVNGLAATNIFVPGTAGPTALVGGEIAIGNVVQVIYDGTRFELVSAPGAIAANTVVAGSIAAGAATLVKLDTTGALNTVLTGQGAGVAPAWATSTVLLSPVRQTALSGPQASGSPTFLPATSVSLTLTSQNIAAGAPLIVSAANGFGPNGNVDVIGQATANLTWSGLTANSTNYLAVLISGGTLGAFPVLLAPIYQYGGTISVINNQYTFDISQMKMLVGNGTIASQINVVFVGEAVTNASTVTSTVAYQYLGYYDSGFINTLPLAVIVSKNSNLGTTDQLIKLTTKCLTVEYGYSIGDVIDGLASQASLVSMPYIVTRNISAFNTGSAVAPNFSALNKGTGSNVGLTAANWAYRVIARRSWGGS